MQLAFRGFAVQVSSLHAVEDFIDSVDIVNHGWFSYYYIIVTPHNLASVLIHGEYVISVLLSVLFCLLTWLSLSVQYS